MAESVVNRFLEMMSAERGAAQNTLEAYGRDVSQFLEYCGNVSLKNISADDIADFVQYLSKKEQLSSKTVARKISAVREFFKFLYTDKIIKENPAADVQTPKQQKPLPKFLTQEEIKQLIQAAMEGKTPAERRMCVMLELMYACGLRVSDIITLEWRNIDFEKRELKKILYKGDVSHTVFLNDNAIKILERWRAKGVSDRFVFGLLPDDFDLRDQEERKRQRLNKNRAILTSLKTLGDKIGLPFNLTMHVARHTFAVWALNRGVDVHKISRLMGHSSVMVTEKVYAKFMPKTLEQEVQDKLNFNVL